MSIVDRTVEVLAEHLPLDYEVGQSYTIQDAAKRDRTVLAKRLAQALADAGILAPEQFAVTYQSPGGRSLTVCCCDRTTARLVTCPVHPEASVTPPGEVTQ